MIPLDALFSRLALLCVGLLENCLETVIRSEEFPKPANALVYGIKEITMINFKLMGKDQVSGLSKMHDAVVELRGVTRFAETPQDFAPESTTRQVPTVALFEHFHFIGGAELTFADWKYVGNWWLDKISSIWVIAGTWEFYSASDYKGDCWVYGPGLYDEVRVNIASLRARS